MSKNKKRLYLAAYPSGVGIGRYHWALLVGPKQETPSPVAGQRYHIKNVAFKQPLWQFEATDVKDIRVTVQLLARVTIAKVLDEQRLIEMLENVPVNPSDWTDLGIANEPKWTCRVWVIAALKAIKADDTVIGTNMLDNIEGPGGVLEQAKVFVVRQVKNGRYDADRSALEPKPLLDMMSGKELYH